MRTATISLFNSTLDARKSPPLLNALPITPRCLHTPPLRAAHHVTYLPHRSICIASKRRSPSEYASPVTSFTTTPVESSPQAMQLAHLCSSQRFLTRNRTQHDARSQQLVAHLAIQRQART